LNQPILGSEGQNQKWRAQDSNHNKGRCDLTLCPDVVDVLWCRRIPMVWLLE
jgi:hypothetical protein